MTVAIKVNPNAYAIGPSLYDFAWDEFEKRQREREARDAAFETEFEWWRMNHFCDRQRPKDKAEIAEVMSEALSALYGDDKDSAAFDQVLFVLYCSNSNQNAKNLMYELLDKHIRAAVRKQWERQQKAA